MLACLRRACERRAAAASWQVALAAAKFAGLSILDWTLVSVLVRWKCHPQTKPPKLLVGGRGWLAHRAKLVSRWFARLPPGFLAL